MKIAAFNVQKLGVRKVNNEDICKNLIKIVSRYSVVVMLEVMDVSGKVMKNFLSKLNKYGRNRNHQFTMKCSESLGRSSYKEKFVFFYREDEVTMLNSYQYQEEEEEEDEEDEYDEEDDQDQYDDEDQDDDDEDQDEDDEDEDDEDQEDEYDDEDDQDQYDDEDQDDDQDEDDEDQEDEYDDEDDQDQYDDEDQDDDQDDDDEDQDDEDQDDDDDEKVDLLAREPFILHFKCPNTVVQQLVLVPVHTKPEDALIELDAVADVVEDVRRRWSTDNIMILGDFNADGRYLSKKKKAEIRLRSADYHWLIDDDVDTTTSNLNDHTYDRIVVFGKTMLNAVVPGSAKAFNFQTEFKLTEKDALSISDHYPVEVELKTNQRPRAQRQRRPTPTEGQKRGRGPQKKNNTPAKRKSGASNTRAKRSR